MPQLSSGGKNNQPLKDAAVSVAKKLQKSGFEALFAGGCVRDMVMGLDPKDYDIATNATPETVQSLFKRTIPVGAQFGVILVIRSGYQFEVATFRSDGRYTDGRRPDDVKFGAAKDDVQRRDFTINGMLYDPVKRKLIDYVSGEEDIKKKIIRCIGNPHERLAEDKLRLLRAVRFSAHYGFEMEEETLKALVSLGSCVSAVSQERICDEFEKIVTDKSRATGVKMLREFGLLAYILPELNDVFTTPDGAKLFEHSIETLDALSAYSFPLSFAALMHEVGKPIAGDNYPEESAKLAGRAARRLKFSNAQRKKSLFLVLNQNSCAEASAAPLYKLKRLLAEENFEELLLLMEAKMKSGCAEEEDIKFIRELHSSLTEEEIFPEPFIKGEDLIRLGLTPSALFSKIIEEIFNAQLDGGVKNKEEALSLVNKLIQ
ncbi:MAG: CCA tRNA nucleotidyltransferase [Planctomycetota bacterium]